MQGDAAARPVVRLQRRGAGHLVEIERLVAVEDGDVDGLADLRREPGADGTSLLHDVEPRGGRAREPQDADAEAVAPALVVLVDQVVVLQGGEKPEGRGAVHA